MCWYIPPNMLVAFDGSMVSLPASFIPLTKIAEDGTAIANAATFPTTGLGWKGQARFGTGNQIQRIILIIMRNSKKPAMLLNHLHSFQSLSPHFSARVTGITLRIPRYTKRKALTWSERRLN